MTCVRTNIRNGRKCEQRGSSPLEVIQFFSSSPPRAYLLLQLFLIDFRNSSRQEEIDRTKQQRRFLFFNFRRLDFVILHFKNVRYFCFRIIVGNIFEQFWVLKRIFKKKDAVCLTNYRDYWYYSRLNNRRTRNRFD